MSIGEKLLALTNEIREKGDTVRALQLADEAAVHFLEEGNLPRAAESFSAKLLAYRHLYQKTGDRAYLIIAKLAATTSVELAVLSVDKKALAIPYFNLAKAFEDLGQIKDAVDAYKIAVENIINNAPASHDRPGVVADFKVHLTIAEYILGDKSALERAENALEELKKSGESKISRYNQDVWVSGGYMRLAEILKNNNPKKSATYLKKAQEVINENPELTVRKEQWNSLAKKLGQSVVAVATPIISLCYTNHLWNRTIS